MDNFLVFYASVAGYYFVSYYFGIGGSTSEYKGDLSHALRWGSTWLIWLPIGLLLQVWPLRGLLQRACAKRGISQ